MPRPILPCALLLLGGLLTLRAAEPEPLRISAIPDADPTKLLQVFEPLAAYLSQAVGRPVRFTPVTKYELVVEALAAKQLELAWLGGYTSIQADRACAGGITRLAMRESDAQFTSVFIAAPGSGIATLADLRGKTFAFGSQSSTSGHLMPRFFMLQEKIDVDAELGKITFTGAHDKTIKLVESGVAQAGAVSVSTWKRMTAEKAYDPAKVAAFHTTPPFVDYCWAVRKDLDQDLQQRLKTALLALDPAQAEHKRILDAHSAARYIPAVDGEWDKLKEAARAAGMFK